jgi:DNA uptake protein ComE-like DNA-binding protein
MFEFNKRDRIGIITLSVLLVVLIAANSFLYLIIPEKKYDYSKYEGLVSKQSANTNYSTTTINRGIKDTVPKRVNNQTSSSNTIVVDINAADSLALLDIKGIGPAFASRIIKYRNLLGGFVKKEQLLEVYGFDAERYDEVKDHVKIGKGHTVLNLNDVSFKELNKHPYVSYDLTKAIFNLKKKLGTFKAVDDIKQIDLVTDELYNKLAPYLTVQ